MDLLRGFAVLLMVIDHIFFFILHLPFFPFRIPTRLAMPLFAMVCGYLIPFRSYKSIKRGATILLICALLLVPVDLYLHTSFTLLFSFAIALPFWKMFEKNYPFILLVLLIISFFDFSRVLIDYGIASPLFLIGVGANARKAKKEMFLLLCFAFVLSLCLSPFGWMPWEFLAAPFAFTLMVLCEFNQITNRLIEFFGRHALSIYVTHFFIIAFIRMLFC